VRDPGRKTQSRRYSNHLAELGKTVAKPLIRNPEVGGSNPLAPTDPGHHDCRLKIHNLFAWLALRKQLCQSVGIVPKQRDQGGSRLDTSGAVRFTLSLVFPRAGAPKFRRFAAQSVKSTEGRFGTVPSVTRCGHGGRSLLPVSRTRVGVSDRSAQERAQQHSMEPKISRIRHNRKCTRTVFIPTQGTPESSIAESAWYS